MRRMLAFMAVVFSMLCIPGVCDGKEINLRAYGGYGATAMSDINTTIDFLNDVLAQGGFPRNQDHLGGGPVFGAGVVIPIHQLASVILAFEHQRSSTNNSFNYQSSYFLGEWDTYANFTSAGIMLFPSPEVPVFLIATAGWGFGFASQEVRAFLPDIDMDLYGGVNNGKGHGPIVEFGVGGILNLGPNTPFSVFGEGRYRYRNLGEFEGDFWGDSGTGHGPIRLGTGQVTDFDFSGFAITAGLQLQIGI